MTRVSQPAVVVQARRHPCAVLLLVQLLGIVVHPFLDAEPVGRAVFGVFSVVVLAVGVQAVRMSGSLTSVALVLAVPTAVLTLVEGVAPGHEVVQAVSSVGHAAFYFYVGWALIRYMFEDGITTADELWATAATFTVLAWAFAYVYVVVQVVWPGSFTAAVDADLPRTWMDLLYVSMTTLSGTGLSDIVPVTPHARSFVALEQMAGLFYLALVVARVAALAIRRYR